MARFPRRVRLSIQRPSMFATDFAEFRRTRHLATIIVFMTMSL